MQIYFHLFFLSFYLVVRKFCLSLSYQIIQTMKTITAYKLSDGRIVENEKEAIKTEKVLTFKKEMEKLADENYVRFDYEYEFADFMDAHAEKLFAIFTKRFGSSEKSTIFTPTKTKTIL